MSELTGIFKLIEEHTFSDKCCFLCGEILTEENKTEEHVIPKWLQHKFNLWNQKLHLLNGTLLPYKYLTIPCCFSCNNESLNPFEKKLSEAAEKGFEEFIKLEKEIIYLWIAKIFFGILYKEMFLSLDRKNNSSTTITNPELLKSFDATLLFLQGIRGHHKFKDFFPSSIYIYKLQKPETLEHQWDFRDNIHSLFVSIRMGDIGIISLLQDGESLKDSLVFKADYKTFPLHPLQFSELTAQFLYHSILFNRTPKYITTQINDTAETIQLFLRGLSDKPLFDDWDINTYAKILSEVTGVPIEHCQPEPTRVWTWLHDTDFKPIFIDINQYN